MFEITSVEQFEKEVTNSNIPVVIDFMASWCGPCKTVGPMLEDISKKKTDYKFVKVNVDTLPDIAASFEVISIPTVIYMENGKVINQIVGAVPKSKFEAALNEAFKK